MNSLTDTLQHQDLDLHDFDIQADTSETEITTRLEMQGLEFEEDKDPKYHLRPMELAVFDVFGQDDAFAQYNTLTDTQKSTLVSIYE